VISFGFTGRSKFFLSQLTGRIKSGDAVNIKVVKHLGDYKWQVSLNGKLHVVRSHGNIKEGSVIRARALWSGNKLFLTPVKRMVDYSEVIKNAGIPDDRLSRLIVESFKRSGLPLNPESLLLVRRELRKAKKEDAFLARLLVLIHDKNLKLSQKSLKELLSITEGRSGEGGGSYREEKYKSNDSDSDSNEKDLKKAIAERLKRQLHNYNNERTSPLHIFNSIRGKHDNWIIIPFSFLLDERDELSGSIRINCRRSTFSYAFITVNSKEARWGFSINMSGKEKKITSFCNNSSERIKALSFFPKLAEKLREMDIKIDDNIKDEEESDGFSSEKTDLYTGIDTTV